MVQSCLQSVFWDCFQLQPALSSRTQENLLAKIKFSLHPINQSAKCPFMKLLNLQFSQKDIWLEHKLSPPGIRA